MKKRHPHINNLDNRWRGSHQDWLTPPEVFDALGCAFDLDPCSPVGVDTFVPAARRFTKTDDGLHQPWTGRVWMNPPFGENNAVRAWLFKFFEHGNGIGIVKSDTSTKWFSTQVSRSPILVFPVGRVRYRKVADRRIARAEDSPGFPSVLFCAGDECRDILQRAQLGLCYQPVTQ